MARDLNAEQPWHFDDKALRQREHVEENVLLCDMFKWATRSDSRGVLLLGDPGAGKTTGLPGVSVMRPITSPAAPLAGLTSRIS